MRFFFRGISSLIEKNIETKLIIVYERISSILKESFHARNYNDLAHKNNYSFSSSLYLYAKLRKTKFTLGQNFYRTHFWGECIYSSCVLSRIYTELELYQYSQESLFPLKFNGSSESGLQLQEPFKRSHTEQYNSN